MAFKIYARFTDIHFFLILSLALHLSEYSFCLASFRPTFLLFGWIAAAAATTAVFPTNNFDAVIVVPFAGMDMWGMLHTVSRADFIRSTIKVLEKYMKLAFEQSVTHGPQARQFVVLFDMAGFNVKQYTWRPGM